MLLTLPHVNCRPRPDQTIIVPFSRQNLLIAFGLASTIALLGDYQMVVGVYGVYHNDAIYIIIAKASALEERLSPHEEQP